jgi:hypothetical protein
VTGATASDDSFHAPATDDPYWTETAWFGFHVPERKLAGAVYPVFRPNLGICSSGVYVWDASAEEPHDILYARTFWHLPMPTDDLTKLTLPSGLSYRQIDPLQKYEVRYDDAGEITLDLVFDAICAPHAPAVGATGHLDQPGHVTGTLVLHGDAIDVDCFEMRDRSWSVRADTGPVDAGYDYAIAGPDAAFLAMSMRAGEQQLVLAGFHLVDGRPVRLVSGERHVERRDGKPVRTRIEADDEEGRTLVAEGSCVNRFAFQSSPNYFAWMSLTDWSFDGVHGWGEDQDVWSPDRWRALNREARR